MMHIGIAADHGWFELEVQLTRALKAAGYDVPDFGAHELYNGTEIFDSMLSGHKTYIHKHGEDMPEIRNWR